MLPCQRCDPACESCAGLFEAYKVPRKHKRRLRKFTVAWFVWISWCVLRNLLRL